MRTLAKIPNGRPAAPAGSTSLAQPRVGQGHKANAVRRAVRTDASQRQTEADVAAADVSTTVSGPDWSFGRMPVHAPAPAGLPARLELGMPGDVHEQEADRLAGQVMRMPEPSGQSKAPADIVGHATAPAAQVQIRATGASGAAAAPPIVHDVLRSPGQRLDAATRAFMEPRFGQDFGHVRVHTDARAAESAAAIGAAAYTVGGDIAFGRGRYVPGSTEGFRLLAHELTHVAQQSGGADSSAGTVQRQPVSGGEVTTGDPGDPEKASSHVTVTIEIVSGSKPAPGEPAEDKIYGGKKGGHVVINLGDAGVLGFSNTGYGGHLFPKKKGKRNAKFEHYTQKQWQTKTEGKQVVSFEIDISPAQEKALIEAFEGEPEVDYSVFGYRCASYALQTLDQAKIIERSDFSIKYILAITPAALIRFLERQGYSPKIKEGSEKRKWNRKFKLPEKPASGAPEQGGVAD